MAIRLLAGLGNPGSNYAFTRHNAGAWWLESAGTTLGLEFGKAPDYKSLLASTKIADENRWFLLPLTYMNLSGQAVASFARFYKIPPADILIAHDELDLPPGHIKLKRGGGHAGHNGLKSVQAQLGSNDFWRLRIGIGHPGARSEVTNWVLQKPQTRHRTAIEQAIDHSVKALPQLLSGSLDAATRSINSIKTNADQQPDPAPE